MDEKTTKAMLMARSLIAKGKRDQAAGILQAVVDSTPNLEEAWYMLGLATDDLKKQVESFEEVLRINPNNASARQQLAILQKPDTDYSGDNSQPSAGENSSGFGRQAGGDNSHRPFTTDVLRELEAEIVTVQSKKVEEVDPHFDPANDVRLAIKDEFDETISDDEVAAQLATKAEMSPRVKRILAVLSIVGILVIVLVAFSIWWMLRNPSQANVAATATMSEISVPANTPVPTAAATLPSPEISASYHTTACPFSVPMGTRVKCGMVSVPLDRENAGSQRIELPVVLYRSKKPNADVIMYLQDGPGKESIDWSLSNFDNFVTPLLDEYDVLFFDARGTGRSTPALTCPDLNPVFLDAYFNSGGNVKTFDKFIAIWSKCREGFAAQLTPAAFTSRQAAADVFDIVRSMGYEKIDLLGISYGARLALSVMRDYPEIVSAVVLDSPVSLGTKIFNTRAANLDYSLQKLFADCASDPKCNTAYPALEKVFKALLSNFGKRRVTLQIVNASTGFSRDVNVGSVELLNAVSWGLNTAQLVPALPMAIYDMENRDYTFLNYALGIAGNEYSSLSFGTYYSSVCAEQVYASTPQELNNDLGSSWPTKESALAGLFGSSERIFDLCNAWGARAYDPQDSQPVSVTLPSMVLSGQYDPTTPTLFGEDLASALANSYYYEIPGKGHAVTLEDACSISLVKSFFRDHANAPDSGCLNGTAFQFFIPYDGVEPVPLEEMVDPANLLRGLIPQGWKKDPQVVTYYRRAYLYDPTQVTYTSFAAPESVALPVLTRTFGGDGFDHTAAFTSTHLFGKVRWNLYITTYKGNQVTIGMAQFSRNQTLAVVLVATRMEQTAFNTGLLQPILESYAPNQ